MESTRERHRRYNRKSYWKHKDSRDKRVRDYQIQVKIDVISHYSSGTNRCACCGVGGLVFLTIDHIYGNGAEERRANNHKTGKMFYVWLRKHEYPKGFQVLCYNCNQAKRQLLECPHKELLEVTGKP